VTAVLRSHLLAGTVGHRRLRGVDYAFTHRVWYLAVDLDELDEVAGRSWLVAYEGRGLLRILDRDHLGQGTGLPLREAVRSHLEGAGIDASESSGWRITLIAYPRVLGYVFNPVCFYLCHDAAGVLRHVIAEVHNTHGEWEAYDFTPDEPGAPVFTSSATKRFYVSPFIGPRAEYRLSVVESETQLAIAIHESEEGASALDAAVRLRRVPLSDGRLLRLLAGDPLVPLKTIVLIAWHALRMWRRGQPWDRFRPRREYARAIAEPPEAPSRP
jgi:uncharacterized protein